MDWSEGKENYSRIARAIRFISSRAKQQPGLEEVASEVGLSPFHFQRMFAQGTGVSPKKFLQYITLDKARLHLRSHSPTLFDTVEATGLSGTGRLHELFVNIEAMTPAEYRDGDQLEIFYHTYFTIFGLVLIASTSRGICKVAFLDENDNSKAQIKASYPHANLRQERKAVHQQALSWLENIGSDPKPLNLHLQGTPFQLQVWEALLGIPEGNLATYSELALKVGNPGASRAVGSAVGANPIAYLIPCHRVIRSDGGLGGYRWGTDRKQQLLGWEFARTQEQ